MATEFFKHKKYDWAPHIKFKGTFDFDAVYRAIQEMFSQKSYLVTEKKNIQKASGAGVEIEIEVYGYRNETEYITYDLTAYIHAWELNDVEVEVNGVKKTMQTGRVTIDFESTMTMDYHGAFEKTTFLKKLGKLYNEKFMGREMGLIYWDKIYYEMYKFHAAVKEALDMYSAYTAY